MDLTSQIFNLDSKQDANLFVKGLVKGSYMHERFLESPPYDLDDLRARTEGILRVEESRRQIAKNAAIAISRNNSQARESKDYGWKVGNNSLMGRPLRDTTRDKRKRLEYFEDAAKRYKTDEEDFDCIFTMPQEKIFAELKDENIL